MKEECGFLGKMNRLYDSMEPRVVDDDMLKVAVGEQGPQEEAGQLAKQEGILFKDVLSLQLDFQSKYPGCPGVAQGGAGETSEISLTFSALSLSPRIPYKVSGQITHIGMPGSQA